ncbi:MAG TPA: DNA-directed RNA polymerase subunit omega [Firmicutes bacterium]|nr:DNA-directed RNA polymerase subunit omega [Candidatus Fermentithermobacillaceae bacterium]
MTNPPLEDLMKKVDSKYSLVIAAAKRARQIVSQKETNALAVHKPVTIALEEIASGKVKIRRKESKKGADI